MSGSIDFWIGFAAGLNLMGFVAMIATDRLLRHYLRRGWLRFPYPGAA